MQKTCKKCGKQFTAPESIRKYCSPKCYTDAKRDVRKIKTCRICNKQFAYVPSRLSAKFCSLPCFYAASKKKRMGKGNPNYRGGLWAKKTGLYRHGSKTAGIHLRACSKYKRKFIEKHGHAFCEVCRISQAFQFATHHVYYASRYPKHPNLHDPRNLILVCNECHRKFHASELKGVFERLELERGLKDLFQ